MPLSSQKWPGGSRSGARQGHSGAAGVPSSGEGAEQRRASGPEQGGSFKELGCLMLPCLKNTALSNIKHQCKRFSIPDLRLTAQAVVSHSRAHRGAVSLPGGVSHPVRYPWSLFRLQSKPTTIAHAISKQHGGGRASTPPTTVLFLCPRQQHGQHRFPPQEQFNQDFRINYIRNQVQRVPGFGTKTKFLLMKPCFQE